MGFRLVKNEDWGFRFLIWAIYGFHDMGFVLMELGLGGWGTSIVG